MLGGDVADDYGLTRLAIHYRVSKQDNPKAGYKTIALPLAPRQVSQAYYYQWNTVALNMQPGDKLEYFVQVWDNDGLHGPKNARTRTFELKVPTKRELEKELDSNAQSVGSQISKTLKKANKLQDELAK